MKKVAILQSNYIPWKGYFDLINSVDEFILYDDMQYTKRDWRNRNLVKTPQGLKWLSIPVEVKGKYYQKIQDTLISDPAWHEKHWRLICQYYSKALYFNEFKLFFQELYSNSINEKYLSKINYLFLVKICELLGIKTKISWSHDYLIQESDKNHRLMKLCLAAQATDYLSGPSAKDYMDLALFSQNHITVSFMDYSNYPVYPQLYGQFEHGVTILDLIFNTGHNAKNFMKSFNKNND